MRLGQLDEEVAHYRPVSRMAVVGLLAGLASSLAPAHPVLWTIPPLALLFCWMGLRNIRASGGALTGSRAATAGILLAIFFAASAASNFTARRVIARRQAQEIADRWIQLIEDGAIQHAHQWTMPYVMREAPDVPLAAFYEEQDGKESLAAFLEKEPARSLSDMRIGDRIEELGCVDLTLTRSNRFVGFRYRLIRVNQPPLDFGLSIRRFTDSETFFHSWTVTPYTPDEETDD